MKAMEAVKIDRGDVSVDGANPKIDGEWAGSSTPAAGARRGRRVMG